MTFLLALIVVELAYLGALGTIWYRRPPARPITHFLHR
jgi:hypothetical protein